MENRARTKLVAVALIAGAIGLGGYVLQDWRSAPALPDSEAALAAKAAAPVATSDSLSKTSAETAASAVLPPPAARTSSAFMPELRRAADAGDAAAACKLAFELNGCTEMQKMELADSVGGGMKDSPDQPLATVAAHHQRCSAATEADLQDRYRYQAQVFGSGNAAAERWFVQSPLLDDDDFLINSPNAIDFRRRSQAYLAQAMKRKDIQDLKVLLQVYMPPGYGRSMSRLRVRDDAMFLALSAAAEQADVADEHDRALAAQVRRKAGGDVLALATQRAAHVGGPWRSAANAGPADAFFAPEACATLGNR